MKAYLIKISDVEVERWSDKEGCYSPQDRWTIDMNLEKIVYTNKITKKDVIEAIKEMLCHKEKISENDLFDGNETYYTFSRLEDEDGNELEAGKDGYYVTYFIEVYGNHCLSTNQIV